MKRVLMTWVSGIPAPQGSKRHVGAGRMVESSARVAPWREAVKWAVAEAHRGPITATVAPVSIEVSFYLPRPGGHYGTGRNAARLRPGAPETPAVKPDLDKLLRSTLDALEEVGLLRGDAQVVGISASKVYAPDAPGAYLDVREMP